MKELERTLADVQQQLVHLKQGDQNRVSMIVFSGELDKQIAAFNIATGAAASGMEVVMFFTFWGISALRDAKTRARGKDFFSRLFGFLLPRGVVRLKLSQMNFFGAGPRMIHFLMRKKRIPSLKELIKISESLGVHIYICQMSMDLLGFQQQEMIQYEKIKYCGVATFIAQARDSKIQLFIS